MATEIPITNVTLPNASIRLLSPDGTLTLPWRKFFQDMFQRTGGSNNTDNTAAILAQLGIISSEAALAKFQSNSAVTLANEALSLSEQSTILSSLVFGADGNSGTVTSVSANGTTDIGVTGSPITSSGTLNISLTNTAVTSGTYTNPTITVDSKGRITNAVSTSSTNNGLGYTRYTANSIGNTSVTIAGPIISNTSINRLTFNTFAVWDNNTFKPSLSEAWDMYYKPAGVTKTSNNSPTNQIYDFNSNTAVLGATFCQLSAFSNSVSTTISFTSISNTQVQVYFTVKIQPFNCQYVPAMPSGLTVSYTANATAPLTHYIDVQVLGNR
ncbi:MAG: hypothetical protein ACOVJ8_09065 [Sediminibacterium sp.]